jgi:hypothetical protein
MATVERTTEAAPAEEEQDVAQVHLAGQSHQWAL